MAVDSMIGNFWNELQRMLNISVEIVELSNGTTDEHVLMMRDPRYHVGLADIAMTKNRFEHADFTMAFFDERAHLFLRHLGHSTPRWRGFLEPFAPTMWLSLLGALLATALGLFATAAATAATATAAATRQARFSDSLLCAAAIFCMQGSEAPAPGAAARAMQVGAYLTAVSVFAAYSGQVVSRLAVRRAAVPFRSAADFAADDSYALSPVNGTSEFEILRTSRDPMLRRLVRGKRLVPTPVDGDGGDDDGDDSPVRRGVAAMCRSRTALFASHIAVRASLGGACGAVALPDFSVQTGMALALPKGSPYRRFFDHVITILRERGVIKKILWELHIQEMPSIIIPLEGVGVPEIISILVFIGISCMLSLLILTIEWWVYYIKNKKK